MLLHAMPYGSAVNKKQKRPLNTEGEDCSDLNRAQYRVSPLSSMIGQGERPRDEIRRAYQVIDSHELTDRVFMIDNAASVPVTLATKGRERTKDVVQTIGQR